MVYCTKCGTKNEDTAKYCIECGGALYEESLETKTEEVCIGPRERREVEACFGLPHGLEIAGIVFGVLIILWGSIWILQQAQIIPTTVEIWPFAVMIIGILIIAGALYRLRRG